MMQHHPHRHHTHALTWCGHFHNTVAADNQFFFFLVNTTKTLTMLQHTNRTNLHRVLVRKPTHDHCSMRHSRTVATAAESSHVHPTLVFQQLPTRPHFQQGTAILYSCFTSTALGYQDGRFEQQKRKVMWLKAGCGAHPTMCPGKPSNTLPLTPEATPKSQMVRKLLYLQWPTMNTIKDSIFLDKL